MRPLDDLVKSDGAAIVAIRRSIEEAGCACTLLPPSDDCKRILLSLQICTDTPLGALAYETGGILVDRGWLRILGSGHPQLPRNLADWNDGRADGLSLVADDVVGGFFAVNRGAFGDDDGMYYWAPDSLQWEPIGFEFDFFLRWSLTAALSEFYQHFRWPSWRNDVASVLLPDHCFVFEPPLWSGQGTVASSMRHTMLVSDMYAMKLAAQQAGG